MSRPVQPRVAEPVDRARPPEPAAAAVRRVVLIGFMAAGKTTVGRLLAAALGWRFVDLDERIERAEGRRVAEIFAAAGEARFRELEALHTARLADVDSLVLAPGGGWVTDPENPGRLGPGTLSVWLQVGAEAAVRRAARSAAPRPLLGAAEPATVAARLLREREPLYARAELHVATDGRAPHEIARELETRLHQRGIVPRR